MTTETDAEAFAVALGVRVREVDDLAEGAVWVESRHLLLLDAGLSDDRREAAFDVVLEKL